MKVIRIILSVIIAIVTILSLLSCAAEKNPEESDYHPKINAPDNYKDNDVWYCNLFRSTGTPPFSLPDSAKIQNGYFKNYCTGVSRKYYDSFLSDMKSDGFSLVTMKYSDFLFRDDCMIFSDYNEDDGDWYVCWYQKSPYSPQDGISYDEAASDLMTDKDESLSKIRLHPIDITPEGFYERTGGQIFAVPYYSYDGFKSSNQESLMFEDNEWYACSVYYIKGNDAFIASLECVSVCDIDGDGEEDVLLLSSGPTSGLFTFSVTCVTKRGVYDTIFNTDYGELGFFSKNGKIVVESVGYDSVHHYYDILLEEHNEEIILMLYDDAQALQIWGLPNSRMTGALF